MKIIRIKHGTFHISYYYFTASTLQTPNWKLVETTKEYKDGYAKCIQVQEVCLIEILLQVFAQLI